MEKHQDMIGVLETEEVGKMGKQPIISFVVSISYMIFIFYLSSFTNETLNPKSIIGVDIPHVLMHIVEYSILGVLMAQVATHFFDKTFSIFYSSFTFSACYGVLDEVHQFFVSTRHCTLIVVYSNVIGSVAGVLAFLALIKHKKKHEETNKNNARALGKPLLNR